jgi:hypothetical protein
MHVRHAVRPAAGGSRIELAVEGAAAPWSLVALAYAPVAGLIARNIARVAESEAGSPSAGRSDERAREVA